MLSGEKQRLGNFLRLLTFQELCHWIRGMQMEWKVGDGHEIFI